MVLYYLKNNKIIIYFLILILLIFVPSCKGKSWDMYKANRLSMKNDLTALLEARNIYLKYAATDLTAKNGLKNTDNSIGEIYYLNENFTDAIKYFQESLQIDPNQALIHYYLGVCYANLYKSTVIEMKKKDFKELALFHYKRSIELAPNFEQAHYGLGVFYFYGLKNYEKALYEINRVLEINKKNIRALFVKAQIMYLQGEFEKAYNIYLTILKLLPKKDDRREQVLKNIERLKNEILIKNQ